MSATGCATCGRQAAQELKRCSGCKGAHYCSADCQRAHWPTHKPACIARAEAIRAEEWRKQEKARQDHYDELTRRAVENLTPEEIKWKAYLATHGPGIHVTEANLKDYTDVGPAPSDAKTLEAKKESREDTARRYPAGFGVPLVNGEADGTSTATAPATASSGSPSASHWDATEIKEGLGRKYSTYSWHQTVSDVEARILLPEGTRSKDVRVNFDSEHIQVTVGGQQSPVVDHPLRHKIYVGSNSDDRGSYWEIIDGRVLVLHLTKWLRRNVGNCPDASATWWKGLFLNAGEAEPSTKYPPTCYYDLKEK